MNGICVKGTITDMLNEEKPKSEDLRHKYPSPSLKYYYGDKVDFHINDFRKYIKRANIGDIINIDTNEVKKDLQSRSIF